MKEDQIKDFTAFLGSPRTFVRVYELPPRAELTNGYCMRGPVPITFGNVDWFETPVHEGREPLIKFIQGKRYYASHKTYLVLGDHPDFVFSIDPQNGGRYA